MTFYKRETSFGWVVVLKLVRLRSLGKGFVPGVGTGRGWEGGRLRLN